MILSRSKLDEILAAITDDFNHIFFILSPEEERDQLLPIMIDQLATNYLGLEVVFAPLSADNSVYGLTAYALTHFAALDNGEVCRFAIKENQVVLDTGFTQRGQIKKLCGKCRFTLVYECAYQIFFQMGSDEIRAQWKDAYSTKKAYSIRDL